MESFRSLRNMLLETFPPKPTFTEQHIPDLTGKVCIVTGANTGVGKEVARILYQSNATVYLAARSQEKTLKAIEDIRATAAGKTTSGQLSFLRLDLADLTTIKPTVDEFLAKETQLHLLINNAGVGFPESGSKTKQGLELQLGVNCVGPFLFTKLLSPTIAATAKTSPASSVRVVWVSSSAINGINAKGYMNNLDYHADKSIFHKYAVSKVGNYFHATEYAARYKQDGIVSVSLNPGNLDSDLWRTQGAFVHWLLRKAILYPNVFGAYTELFAGLSPAVTMEHTGSFIAPWGRLWEVPGDKSRAAKAKAAGGGGIAADFWEWSEKQVESFI
ncbi:hypothetical protein S40285_09126 [Stachybotrys chlorohalonatus IBT 40285]|uniref:Uncharacterized protein n=1 Tax=Stachybotrys chlorohalonatus (strain IBT 40285) TaxID=1283841 RepID=A0A084QIE2_STAC4|nr:hypothetical protein S40285_09126 [Stachybotrys chlorohalonata IBT 40285]